jgi:3-hydroxyacyl-[acyl-carrier-protein] dehydratase
MREEIARAFQSITESPPGRIVASFLFSKDQEVFGGHFPGNPVLPGVFHVEMVRFALEVGRQRRFRLARIDKCKFMKPVCPGQTVTLNAAWNERDNATEVKAILECDGSPVAKMSLSLLTETDGPLGAQSQEKPRTET